MIWAKPDGTGGLHIGPTVTTDSYTLNADSEPRDGWTSHVNETAAYEHYGLTPPDADPIETMQAQVAELEAVIATLLDVPPDASTEERLTAVTARLDKLAPVRSEHDVPADPTYLPPATDLRTPR